MEDSIEILDIAHLIQKKFAVITGMKNKYLNFNIFSPQINKLVYVTFACSCDRCI